MGESEFNGDILKFIKLLLEHKGILSFGFTFSLGLSKSNIEDTKKFISEIPDGLKDIFEIDTLSNTVHDLKSTEVSIHCGEYCIAKHSKLFDSIMQSLKEGNEKAITIIEDLNKETKPKLTLVK